MKNVTPSLFLTASALAHVVSAVPNIHARRDVTETELFVTTVVKTVTVDGPAPAETNYVQHLKQYRSHYHGYYGGAAASSSAASSAAPASAASSLTVSQYDTQVSSAAGTLPSTVDGYESASSQAVVSSTATPEAESEPAVSAGTQSAQVSTSASTVPFTSVYADATTASIPTSSPLSSAQSTLVQSTYGLASSSASPASTAASSTAPDSPSPSQSASSGNGYTGVKAGLSGFPDCVKNYPDAIASLMPYIGWYSDYQPDTADFTQDGNTIKGIPMLWGDAQGCAATSAPRVAAFEKRRDSGQDIPIMFGFFEPDSDCITGSSQMPDVGEAVDAWNELLAPLANKTVLGSPSPANQYDEKWLAEFAQGDLEANFTITSAHINKPNLAEVQKVIEHYQSYGKKIWVSEFSLVQDKPSFSPINDQGQINDFINQVVPYFECHPDIIAYGPSSGMGLARLWAMIDETNKVLTETGLTYLAALKDIKTKGCSSYSSS